MAEFANHRTALALFNVDAAYRVNHGGERSGLALQHPATGRHGAAGTNSRWRTSSSNRPRQRPDNVDDVASRCDRVFRAPGDPKPILQP